MSAITLAEPFGAGQMMGIMEYSKAEEISKYLNEIGQSTKQITDLMMVKNEMTCAISRALKNKSLQRTKMSEEQMDLFRKFSDSSKASLGQIAKLLEDIQHFEDIDRIKMEILNHETDYFAVVKGLKKHWKKQQKVVQHLNRYIQESRALLRIIVDEQ